MPPGAGRADNSFTLRPSTSRAGETQVAADGNVASDSDSPFPGPDISPTNIYLPAFPAAEVAEAATGGLNWIRELFQNGLAVTRFILINDYTISPKLFPQQSAALREMKNSYQRQL